MTVDGSYGFPNELAWSSLLIVAGLCGSDSAKRRGDFMRSGRVSLFVGLGFENGNSREEGPKLGCLIPSLSAWPTLSRANLSPTSYHLPESRSFRAHILT